MRSVAISILLVGLLAQCHEPNIANRDYFPLNENTDWEYLHQYFATDDNKTFLWADTVKLTIKGDTVLDGITYKKVVDDQGAIDKALRKEGNKYYGRSHEVYQGFTNEYLFLDEDATLNTTWTNDKGNGNRTVYTVVAVNGTRTYNSTTYKEVMELKVEYYLGDDLNYTNRHYYARGVGEIYAFYPYPSSFTYSDLDISLLNYAP
jgi:hypothetical protein